MKLTASPAWSGWFEAHMQACEACGDPLDESGQCARCDWGSGNWKEWATENPSDPFRDLKSPVQSRVILPQRWSGHPWSGHQYGETYAEMHYGLDDA